eukprot:5426447-Pyramimonas_sp.AAC.1
MVGLRAPGGMSPPPPHRSWHTELLFLFLERVGGPARSKHYAGSPDIRRTPLPPEREAPAHNPEFGAK